MKIKHTLVSGLLTFFYTMASILVCLVVEALLLYILDRIILISYPVQTIIRMVIYTVGAAALIGFLGYHEAYREADASTSESVLGSLLAAVPHLLLSLLFHFQGFIAGGVRFTAGLVYHGWAVSHERVATTPIGVFLVVFLLYTVLYAATLAVCKYFGAKQRLIDRAELHKVEMPADAAADDR